MSKNCHPEHETDANFCVSSLLVIKSLINNFFRQLTPLSVSFSILWNSFSSDASFQRPFQRMASTSFSILIMSTIFVFVSVCPYHVSNQDTSNDGDDLLMLNKLRTQLLRSRRYNKNARPVVRHTTVTNVTFTMFIRRFLELNHKESSLKTYATIYCVSTVPYVLFLIIIGF